MVQAPIQQKCEDEYWSKLSKANKQTFPKGQQAAQNFQQKQS